MQAQTIEQKKASILAEIWRGIEPVVKKYDLTGPISSEQSLRERIKKAVWDIPDSYFEQQVELDSDWVLNV